MLALHIITVGRDKDGWVSEQVSHYLTLLKKYARLEMSLVPETKYGKGADISRLTAGEGEAIISRLRGGHLIVLDAAGRQYDTPQLAALLHTLQNRGNSLLEFVIGGPYGVCDTLKHRADLVLSLSPMTMSHQIVRGVLLEQLYRVLDLNAGGRYHK